VIGANRALDQLSAARRGGDWTAINQLESDLAFHVSGHLLHSVFWTNLSPHPVSRPGGELRMAMDDGFGSFGLFREQFGRAALGVQGSGWVALAWEPLGGHLVIEQLRDNHASSVLGTHLLLVCDVWEHCYDRQHGHDRSAWIDAFWHLVDWADVERRFVGTGVFDEFYVDPLASPSLRRLRPPSAGRADLPHASRTDTHG
jgi:Fe-Mn family superoxide dismutase